MKKIKKHLIIISLVLSTNINGQSAKIDLYPEGIDCLNVLKQKIDYDESGRIFRKVVNPQIWYYPSSKLNDVKDKTAVLIIPGGGYEALWIDKEGVDVAKWLNELGISAFVLKHRIPYWEGKDCRSDVALADAQRAVRIIRKNSKKWAINSEKIGVLGFSAGGHLASSLSTHHDQGLKKSNLEIEKFGSRPDFSILIYPVVTMKYPYVHTGSRKSLIGKVPSNEMVEYFSNEMQVKADTPPAILIHSNDDTGVLVENSVNYYLALRKYKIPAALHVWEDGGHGYGLAKSRGSVKDWPYICQNWMIQRKLIN
tara:strand:+ start:8804 stop:9736 length:933 start_codon:yes stop_codon:yes gene_type:complete